MKCVTAGERLYFLIRDEVIHSIGERNARWPQAQAYFDALDGGSTFTAYIKGTVAVRATRQLLRYWKSKRDDVGDETQYVKTISKFVREEMFPSIDVDLCRRLARNVEDASQASDRAVKRSHRRAVLGTGKCRCFLCGALLDVGVPKGSAEYPTLEHLWPASMGGDTIEENLLPACSECQRVTKDTLSWEWYNIHNLVLPAEPSQDALDAVDKRTRYARHYFEAMTSAETERLTLKQAFVRLGPMTSPPTYVRTDKPVTFFELKTF
jgi:hypothetical protein